MLLPQKTPITMPSPLCPQSLPATDPTASLEDPDVARLCFRTFCYQEASGPREALTRLRELCRRWLRPEAHSKEQMLELLVLEQFLGALPPEIQAWVRGQRPGSPEEAAALVEGLQQDPEQLLGWITAHVLKREVLPAAQNSRESLGSPLASGSGEPQASASGEGMQDPLLTCAVKEEPGTEGQELAPSDPPAADQSPGEQPGHQEPATSTAQPPRIPEEWLLLDPSQKELYWDTMLEKYGSVVSLAGLPTAQPDMATEPHQGLLHVGPPGSGSLAPGVQSQDLGSGPPACSEAQPCWGFPPGMPAGAGPQPKRKPLYTCEQCGLSFDWKSVFVIHHRSHMGGRVPRPLSTSGGAEKSSSQAPGASLHPRPSLPAARSYTCEDCGRAFSWKSQLVIHRKGHAGQRRHICGDCGRAFDWKSQLVIHRKGHRPEAP